MALPLLLTLIILTPLIFGAATLLGSIVLLVMLVKSSTSTGRSQRYYT